MGYTTTFEGRVQIVPPLNEMEVKYINKFNETRRMYRDKGPYFVDGTGMLGQGSDEDIIDRNSPDPSQPGLWCQWVASEDGQYIEWDGGEKFYSAHEWMQYLIDHFLGTDPIAKRVNTAFDFLQGHTLNGNIEADGEESGDLWLLIVKDNVVSTKTGTVSYE